MNNFQTKYLLIDCMRYLTFSNIYNLVKKLSTTFIILALIACSPDAEKNASNFTTQDDGEETPIEIDGAYWDQAEANLVVWGEYEDDFDDAPSLDSGVTIVVHDGNEPKTVFGSTLVDPKTSNWRITLVDLDYVPCSIVAMLKDTNDPLFMPKVFVGDAPSDCGFSGGTPTPANLPPVALIMPSGDQTITMGSSIDFMGDTSNDPDGNTPLSYSWSFLGGDPVSSMTANQIVTYNSTGLYRAVLTVTDSLGLASEPIAISVNVEAAAPAPNNMAPIAVVMPDTIQTISASDSINFMGDTSSDPDNNTPLTYSWLFPGGVPATSDQANQLVQYNDVGTFTATLTVTDSLGLASEPIAVQVEALTPVVDPGPPSNIMPIAAFTPNTEQIISTAESVNFMDAASSDPDGNIPLSFDWNFPGGTPMNSTMESPGNVTYAAAGSYTATLQVTDSLGLASTIVSVNIIVNDVATGNSAPDGSIQTIPMADMNNTINVSTNTMVNYSGTATDPDGDNMTYDWSFTGANLATSTMLSPGDISYSMAGTYTTTFTVTDSAMNVDASPAMVTVVVTDPAPVNGTLISMIVLNDLHAHLTLHDDLKRNADGSMIAVKRGGLARIASEINMIRSVSPNNVLMNIGDTYHGGVEAFYSLGNDIVAPVNALGIDVGVPGNWDFAYGPNVTRARYTNNPEPVTTPLTIAQPNFPNLAANVTNSVPLFPAGTLLPATFSKVVAGVNIGFIGITSDMVPSMSPLLTAGMTFLEGQQNYVDLINGLATELSNQVPAPDIIVVMSELGLHKDKLLADLITPDTVDVFFSAHTHELTMTPLQSASNALVVEAGNDTYIGRMDINIIPGMPKTFTWRVIPIEATIMEDPAMKALVDTARAPYVASTVNMIYPGLVSSQNLTMPITTPLTTTSYLLSRRNSLENSYNNLFTDLVMDLLNTTTPAFRAAVSPGFRFDATIPGMGDSYEDQTVATGEITIEDIYRFFPVPYILATADISAADLQQVMETNLTRVFSNDVFARNGGWTDGYAGLTINVNLANPDGTRVTSLVYKNTGMPAAATDVISITGCTSPFEVNSTTFCTNGAGFNNVTPLTNDAGAPLTAVDFVIGALNNGDNARFPARSDVNDTSNTPLWPISEFFQPVN